MSDTRTGAQILADIQPKPHEMGTWICLRADLVDDFRDAVEELEASQVEDATSPRLASGVSARTKKLAQKVRDLEEQIEAAQVRFQFRSMSRTRFSELVPLYPPRDGNIFDYRVGYDRDAMLDAQIRECLVEPVFEDCTKPGCEHADCGTWQQLTNTLNLSEYGELARVAQEINGVVTEAPKSPLASRILDKPAQSSRRRHAST
jgi:hypothetical protein